MGMDHLLGQHGDPPAATRSVGFSLEGDGAQQIPESLGWGGRWGRLKAEQSWGTWECLSLLEQVWGWGQVS